MFELLLQRQTVGLDWLVWGKGAHQISKMPFHLKKKKKKRKQQTPSSLERVRVNGRG